MPFRRGKEPKKTPTIRLPASSESSSSEDEAGAAKPQPEQKKKKAGRFSSFSNRFSMKRKEKKMAKAKLSTCPLPKCIDAGSCLCPGSHKSTSSSDSGVSVAPLANKGKGKGKGNGSRFSFGKRKRTILGSTSPTLPGITASSPTAGASAAIVPATATSSEGSSEDSEGEAAAFPEDAAAKRKKKLLKNKRGGGGGGGGGGGSRAKQDRGKGADGGDGGGGGDGGHGTRGGLKRHTLPNNAEKRTTIAAADEKSAIARHSGHKLFESDGSSSSSSSDDDAGTPSLTPAPRPYDAKAVQAARAAHAANAKKQQQQPLALSRPGSDTSNTLGLELAAPGHGSVYDKKAVRVASARSIASRRGKKSARAQRRIQEMTDGRGEEWDLLAKMNEMAGAKIKKLRAQMQLSQSQLQRITRSFTKYDPEKTSHCDRVSLAKIMEDLGRRPDTEEELDDLFRVTDKDGSGLIDFDEFVNMMVVRVGFKATPGIMLKVEQLDDFKANASTKKKKKAKKKVKAPTIETNIVGYSTEKARPKKDSKDPFMRYKDKGRGAEKEKAGMSKEGIPYECEVFMACPQGCAFPLQFELVGDAKVWASGGRLIKDVVACAVFDISKLSNDVETHVIPVYTPLPVVELSESDYGSEAGSDAGGSSSGISGISGNTESSAGGSSQASGSGPGRRQSRVGLKSGRPPPAASAAKQPARRRSTSILDFELPLSKPPKSGRGGRRLSAAALSGASSNGSSVIDSSRWEEDVISVASSVASAFGTRHQPKTSIVEDFNAVPDMTKQIGVLHIQIKRYLQEAKDQLGLTSRDRLGSGLHEEETDANATNFDNAEEALASICVNENPDGEASEQKYRLGGEVDLMWEQLDPSELGIVSLATVLKYLKAHETFAIIGEFEALKLAFACAKGASKDALLKSKVTRRSWVSFREFLSIICHQFYAVRFWDIYERINEEADGAGVKHNFDATVDIREFSFILKRAGYKIDTHDPGPTELSAMFEQCLPFTVGSHNKVALAEVVKVATIKRFFPGVDARSLLQHAMPNGAKRRAKNGVNSAINGGGRAKMGIAQVGQTKLKAKEARQKNKARHGRAR